LGVEMSELPDGWTSCKLKELVSYKKGTKPKSLIKEPKAEYTPYIDIKAFEKKEIRQYAQKASSKLATPNDILVVWDGARSGLAGLGMEGAIGSTIMALTPSRVDKCYIYNFIRSKYDLINTNHKGTGIPHVKPELFWELDVPLPPIHEQKLIVAKLDKLLGKVDAAKARLDRIPVLLKRFRQSVLSAAVTGELTKEWRERNDCVEWSTLSFVESMKDGPQNGLYKPQESYGEGVRILRIDNFYDGKINDWTELKRLKLNEQEKENYGLQNDDIVVNRVNSMPFLGKSALVRNLEEPCVFESNMMRIKLNIEMAYPEYVIYYLNSMVGLKELRKNAKHAVNQSSINQQDVKSAVIQLPPLEEQKEIVRRVEKLFKHADKIEERYNKAKEYTDKLTQSILAKAFRGELVPQQEGQRI